MEALAQIGDEQYDVAFWSTSYQLTRAHMTVRLSRKRIETKDKIIRDR